jgi:hypothetical protein
MFHLAARVSFPDVLVMDHIDFRQLQTAAHAVTSDLSHKSSS